MMEKENKISFRYANAGIRIAAKFIDYIVVLGFIYLTVLLLAFLKETLSIQFIEFADLVGIAAVLICVYILPALFLTFCTVGLGNTLGKKLFRIHLVSHTNKRLHFLQVFGREFFIIAMPSLLSMFIWFVFTFGMHITSNLDFFSHYIIS